MIEADRGRLIPSDDRTHLIPSARTGGEGIGQANLWYPPAEEAEVLLQYKAQVESAQSAMKERPPLRMADTERRLEIEKLAMTATINWCLPYEDVSARKVGWDVQATRGSELLKIEVKGTSASIHDAHMELTRNEFTKMKEHRDPFRVAVVSVQGSIATLFMFHWSADRQGWVDADGNHIITVTPIEVARLRVQVSSPP